MKTDAVTVEMDTTDYIQTQLGVNVANLGEIVMDLVADAGLIFALEKITGQRMNEAGALAVAAPFHILDEWAIPTAIHFLAPPLSKIPVIGPAFLSILQASVKTPALKYVGRIAMAALLQAAFYPHGIDPVLTAILISSTGIVNEAVDMPAIQSALAWRF